MFELIAIVEVYSCLLLFNFLTHRSVAFADNFNNIACLSILRLRLPKLFLRGVGFGLRRIQAQQYAAFVLSPSVQKYSSHPN